MSTFDHGRIISRLLSTHDAKAIFGEVEREIQTYFSRSVTGIQDMKARDNKKLKGDVWEFFCKDWLVASQKYEEVWLFSEIPEDVRIQLSLVDGKRAPAHMDNGIDIVARKKDGTCVAIQCKFRGRGSLPWTTLATFYALCAKSGPWGAHIVMTNCASITRKVPRGPRDVSMCRGTFKGTSREMWQRMVGEFIEHRLQGEGPSDNKKPSLGELREKRLAYFTKPPPEN